MTNKEAITRIDRFLAYLEEICTPQCDYNEALIRRDDITAFVIARDALKERPQGKWEYLKEHITEMRDAYGELNQKDTCQFILNLMGVIEKEGDA